MTFTREEYIKEYTEFYTSGDEGGSGATEEQRTQEYYDILKKGGYKKSMSVLDYGCGWGAMAREIDDYYGVDIIPKAIDLAKKHFPDKEFDVLEIGKLKCKKKDMCIALSVFTHCLLQDVDDCLGDIARNTKSHLLVDILEGSDENSNLHVRYWNKKDFIKKLQEFGFKVKGEFTITAQYGYVHTYLITEKIKTKK